MKKAMIALAGIVSVLMLASCQKEVEIDGDVEREETSQGYRCKVEGTASYVPGERDEDGNWVAVADADKVELVCNAGWIGWDRSTNTNAMKYKINVWNEGYLKETQGKKEKLDLEKHYRISEIKKCGNKYYLCNYYDDDERFGELKVTEGSLESSQFSVEASNVPVAKDYDECKLLTFNLKFTRY